MVYIPLNILQPLIILYSYNNIIQYYVLITVLVHQYTSRVASGFQTLFPDFTKLQSTSSSLSLLIFISNIPQFPQYSTSHITYLILPYPISHYPSLPYHITHTLLTYLYNRTYNLISINLPITISHIQYYIPYITLSHSIYHTTQYNIIPPILYSSDPLIISYTILYISFNHLLIS